MNRTKIVRIENENLKSYLEGALCRRLPYTTGRDKTNGPSPTDVGSFEMLQSSNHYFSKNAIHCNSKCNTLVPDINHVIITDFHCTIESKKPLTSLPGALKEIKSAVNAFPVL